MAQHCLDKNWIYYKDCGTQVFTTLQFYYKVSDTKVLSYNSTLVFVKLQPEVQHFISADTSSFAWKNNIFVDVFSCARHIYTSFKCNMSGMKQEN